MNLEAYSDPNLAAVLLKKYLRDLPQPVFPESIYPAIRRCPIPSEDPTEMASVMFIRETLLPELPHCSYILLSSVLRKYILVSIIQRIYTDGTRSYRFHEQICFMKYLCDRQQIAWMHTTSRSL